MKNIVIGTSGHVDHGKTWLVRALTGMDTDRLAEEKERGITIENGFADMRYGDYSFSFIDVPGHEKFVRNMLAGISGIDMVLLVVDLEEGVMPQTVEHLEILKMLHVRDGITVLTKDDCSDDEEWKELVEEDVKKLLQGSALENAPMIRVSAATGKNIEELKALIARTAGSLHTVRRADIPYRLPIDRVFTIAGFGTVVTGTSVEGTVRAGDTVMVYPQEKEYKIRNLQVHNEFVREALPGQRTAINLAGVSKEELKRGEVIAAPGSIRPSMMLDVWLEIFASSKRTVETGSRVHLFCGSSQLVCKVVLLDREQLAAGEEGPAQLRLEEPAAVKRGDRFIIRFFSPMESIGGGEILDAAAKKAKLSDRIVPDRLRRLHYGTPADIFEAETEERSGEFPQLKTLAGRLSLSEDGAAAIAEELEHCGRLLRLSGDALIHVSYAEKVSERAVRILAEYHAANPLLPGMPREEFKKRLAVKMHAQAAAAPELLLETAEHYGEITVRGSRAALRDFKVALTPAAESLRGRILSQYREAGFEAPPAPEILKDEKDRKTVRDLILLLEGEGLLKKINAGTYMDASVYREAAEAVVDRIRQAGSITLAELRDMMRTSRKFAVAFLDHLDATGITRMEGEARVLARGDPDFQCSLR